MPKRLVSLVLVATVAAGAAVSAVVGPTSVAGSELLRTYQERSPAPGGTAVVRGVVVADDTGQPVRRAHVFVGIQPALTERSREPWNGRASTDAHGRFEVTGVPAGLVNVSASKDGYVNPFAGDADSPRARPIPVAEGQIVENVSLRLSRAGAIVGRLVDEFGDSVSGQRVEVLRREPGSGAVRWMPAGRHTETDDTGAFRAWGLQPGEYLVSAQPRFDISGRPSTDTTREGFAPTFFPGTTAMADAQPVTVRAGRDVQGVVFALMPTRLATIRGRVVGGEAGPTPPRISVMVSRIDKTRLGSGGLGSTAAADGTFEVSRLTPGRYRLTARDGAGGPFDREGRLAMLDVDIDGTDVEGVVLTLRSGSTVTGRVIAEDGDVVAGRVRVMLAPDELDTHLSHVEPAAIQSDDTFAIENVFGRRYVRLMWTGGGGMPLEVAQARAPAGSRLALAAVRIGDVDVIDRAIDFDGRPVSLTIHLTSRLSEVAGTVALPASRPASARAVVVVFPDDDQRWHRESTSVRVAPVDPQGRFIVRGLPPNDRYLAVAIDDWPRGPRPEPDALRALRDSSTPLSVDQGGKHELSLRAVPRPTP